DAGAFDLHADAQLAAAAERGLGARDRLCDTLAAHPTLLPQAINRLLYRIGSRPPARQTLTCLQHRHHAPHWHLDADVVRAHCPSSSSLQFTTQTIDMGPDVRSVGASSFSMRKRWPSGDTSYARRSRPRFVEPATYGFFRICRGRPARKIPPDVST